MRGLIWPAHHRQYCVQRDSTYAGRIQPSPLPYPDHGAGAYHCQCQSGHMDGEQQGVVGWNVARITGLNNPVDVDFPALEGILPGSI